MGKDWACPFFPPSLIFRSFRLSVYVTLSLYFNIYERPIPKWESSFQSNKIIYWYFYIVGWGKTGPAHSFPPPSIMLGSFNLLFSLSVMLLFDCIWTILNDLFQREIKFLNQQVNWYLYIVGWGKTGQVHSFPPPKCWDLSIYPLDFWIMLFFCCIWTLLTYTKQRIKFLNQHVYL